ncbi:lysophospholipid acyltransferase family protein [Haloimpatiens sp. FM7315]|uniref:lysophospholipid acyltransferase family protein n=1 Tax=Haloimpatiens sp. FM7315 TaxID=3298609 RepID=UPI0035A2E5A9
MKTFMKKGVFYLYMIGAIFKTVRLRFLKKYSSSEKCEEYLNISVLRWAKFSLDLVGIDIEIEGKENIPKKSGSLYVANHQGNLDIPCLIYALSKPVGFIAKKELENIPLISTWMKEIHCIFMNRENIRESLKDIKKGSEFLESGYDMSIFPEGTRSKSSLMGEFKKGSLKLAIKAEAPIIPVTIDGTYKCWEGNKRKDLLPGKVKITIHKAVYTKNLDKDRKNNLSMEIREIIGSALP